MKSKQGRELRALERLVELRFGDNEGKDKRRRIHRLTRFSRRIRNQAAICPPHQPTDPESLAYYARREAEVKAETYRSRRADGEDLPKPCRRKMRRRKKKCVKA